MLDFPLFWVITSTEYYSSMKGGNPTFYVRSSCISKILQFTDKNEYEVEYITSIHF